jgi:hypothetical protein
MYALPISGSQGLDIYRTIAESTTLVLEIGNVDIMGFLAFNFNK